MVFKIEIKIGPVSLARGIASASLMTDRYNFSLTTFSPSGKLGQIEYALNAVNQGITCVGIKGTY